MKIEFVSLLRAAWIAAILPILVASLPCACLSSFHRIVLTFASRGKTMPSSSKKFTVPQRFFLHFYVVAVALTTVLLLMTWFYAYRMAPLSSESFHYSTVASHLTGGSHIFSMHKSPSTPLKHRYRVWKTLFLLLLMEVQVLRRLYETVHVFNYSPSAQMHIFGYLTGIFLIICKKVDLIFQRNEIVDEHKYLFYIGSLREQSEKSDEYIIPRGDWFEYVSSPHYLSEIVIYAGLLVASGGSDLTIWLLFGFVVANLVFAAAETHRWYLQKFDNYPRTRDAIFPYIY
ncbi:polyprenol reductase 2 [Macadamia integrifolia]|uniref:polyprenol reductase 2 n=1 Tax=Macadamia integrifolia TaxID=60698 RepID=UPI001C4EC60B|nr:polyprenol reductase 2 [Macadamia integrifolia]